ncbi:ParB N-terminal domain-containing protein [Halobacteriaceae archaeon SHR40]|uniref:ParB/RepB/Spo0J family partition protein n=1 Tax=Halovenus amylolytica TaxID=2500550 RepID=UPI000FE38F30
MIRSERIPVDDLVVDPVQAREEAWTNDETDRQLAASVAEEGLLQDLLVRPIEQVIDGDTENISDASYAIVAGSRRYHAAMDAGFEEVPCKVLEADDLDAAWTSLLENTDRKALSEQEIAQQLALIYEFVRPRADPDGCPQCGESVTDGAALETHYDQTECTPRTLPGTDGQTRSDNSECDGPPRFSTDRQAKRYLAQRFLGRTDDSALSLIEGHLRTAALPDSLQALFKSPDDRTAAEQQTLDSYGIDTQTTLGSGEGKSGTSREIVALHDTVETELADDAVDGTDAVLETVGSLTHPEMSEQELRRSLRDFRHDVTTHVATDASATTQRQQFTKTLQACADDLHETYEEVEPQRPFKKVDVLGPETQRHSRWHARVKASRETTGHGELVRELYQERLETLADQAGWE